MPDLGNLLSPTCSASSHSPSRKEAPSDDPLDANPSSNRIGFKAPSWEDPSFTGLKRTMALSAVNTNGFFYNDKEPGVSRERHEHLNRCKKASGNKNWEDHLRAWVADKIDCGVPQRRLFLPFLDSAPRMNECLICHKFVYPGEEASCYVRGCGRVYHSICAKESHGFSISKKFKCPQHACFFCKKSVDWCCVRCTVASHSKCAPWLDEVIPLPGNPRRAICWRHPTDWRLEKKCAAPVSDIEDVFCHLPLPYVDEEFKIDLTWLEPPPYVHIKRNVYLVKKKRGDVTCDIGCMNCRTVCCENCVCRVQSISCSKACHCSDSCTNRPFRKDKKIKIVKTEFCGWGAEAGEVINKGDFIVEYIGEVIDDGLCEKRLWDMKHNGDENFYMCEVEKDFTIDATFKGNSSRFLNHGCDPNCKLEKWQVDGKTRVGVFSGRSIKVGEPLLYDYRFVQYGPETKCHCGAAKCQGYLGTKKKVGKITVSWGLKRKRTSAARFPLVTL